MKKKAISKKSRRASPSKSNDQAIAMHLYKAVQAYVEAKGGTVVVAGGVELQQWPGDRPHVYRIAVKCVGRVPTIPANKKGTP